MHHKACALSREALCRQHWNVSILQGCRDALAKENCKSLISEKLRFGRTIKFFFRLKHQNLSRRISFGIILSCWAFQLKSRIIVGLGSKLKTNVWDAQASFRSGAWSFFRSSFSVYLSLLGLRQHSWGYCRKRSKDEPLLRNLIMDTLQLKEEEKNPWRLVDSSSEPGPDPLKSFGRALLVWKYRHPIEQNIYMTFKLFFGQISAYRGYSTMNFW